jgi:uncharacterized protein YqgC (DUF456 family)
MLLLLFAAALLACLALIPLGLPGTWAMLAAAFGYNAVAASAGAGAERIGSGTLVAVTLVALVAEVLEFTVAARYTTRYGGSRRAGWGAILGGLAGAVIGVPVPIVGSVVGAFVGAFAGAYVAEWSRRPADGVARRAATGAVLGRAAAAAVKTACGLAIAAWLLIAAWR